MKVKYDWSKSKIEEAVKASISYTETLRRLNVNTRGNNADTLKKKRDLQRNISLRVPLFSLVKLRLDY